MSRIVSANRVATLVGDFDRSPAYAGLADALRQLIGDGRIALDTRLPSERDLTDVLAVSRTTVTRAYADLRDRGFAEARQGAGTFTRIPGGRYAVVDRALSPRSDENLIDLNCAAPSAPPGLSTAYEEAVDQLPAYLSGHGYFPAGLPLLRQAIAATYDARGLPTDPDQIIVTPGALAATAIVALACTGPGDRVLVENPVYPNATRALALGGARVLGSTVDHDGWDLSSIGATIRQTSPRLAYLIPDFQNPTGNLMGDSQREEYAGLLARSRTLAVIDEAHQALALEGQQMPAPMACWAEGSITLGSASKMFWGGLRLGWVRAPADRIDALLGARLSLDLGAPVLEQLVLVQLLADPTEMLAVHRSRLREQRDRLAARVTESLPDWTFRLPTGGLALWCELPLPLATALAAEAEDRGVVVAPGPVFAAEGGLARHVRIPWTRPSDQLEEAVDRLAEAWVAAQQTHGGRTTERVMVA